MERKESMRVRGEEKCEGTARDGGTVMIKDSNYIGSIYYYGQTQLQSEKGSGGYIPKYYYYNKQIERQVSKTPKKPTKLKK